MTTKPPRRVAKETAATPAEIVAAINALTPAEIGRLKGYAQTRIWKLGPKAQSKTADDLFGIAIEELLEDTRRWDKTKVGMAGFLWGAMRSISSNWAKTYKECETPVLEADLSMKDGEGKTDSNLDHTPGKHANPEQQIIDEEKRRHYRDTLDQIDMLFKADEKARTVLEALAEGFDPAEVRELCDLSQTEYNTIMRRIRRTLRRAGLTIS